MNDFLKVFLPIYLLAYFAAAFVWRSYLVWKKTGINPVVFKGSDNAHDFIGKVFKLLFATVVVVVLINSFAEKLSDYFMPIHALDTRWMSVTGIVLLLLSLLWTVIAQAQMGDSWRIGIDSEHRTALVSHGVFGLSRNPIFVGMIVTLLGLLLVLPNAVTLLTFVLGVVLINIQVRLEEEFLEELHGDAYRSYRRQVRRWF